MRAHKDMRHKLKERTRAYEKLIKRERALFELTKNACFWKKTRIIFIIKYLCTHKLILQKPKTKRFSFLYNIQEQH